MRGILYPPDAQKFHTRRYPWTPEIPQGALHLRNRRSLGGCASSPPASWIPGRAKRSRGAPATQTRQDQDQRRVTAATEQGRRAWTPWKARVPLEGLQIRQNQLISTNKVNKLNIQDFCFLTGFFCFVLFSGLQLQVGPRRPRQSIR